MENISVENQRLRDRVAQLLQAHGSAPHGTASPQSSSGDTDTKIVTPETEAEDVENPVISTRAWFHSRGPMQAPIFVGEVCWTTYATRLRRLLGQDPSISPVVRDAYTSEATLRALDNPSLPWPSLARARLLLQVAFNQRHRFFNFLRYKDTFKQLEHVYATNGRSAGSNDGVVTYKLFALFAIGEAYSNGRSNPPGDFAIPGVSYYMRALALMPILSERPNLIHLETLILLVGSIRLLYMSLSFFESMHV